MLPEIFSTACPHDCPSTCALEVETLEGGRIGRVRGARDNTYTDGVICAKVARYAERGCTSIVISTDPQDRAEKSVSEWDIHQLPIGYGMTTDQARLGPVYF